MEQFASAVFCVVAGIIIGIYATPQAMYVNQERAKCEASLPRDEYCTTIAIPYTEWEKLNEAKTVEE